MKTVVRLGLILAIGSSCPAEVETLPAGYENSWATRTVGDWVRLKETSTTPRGETCEIWCLTLLKKTAKSVTVRREDEKDGKTVVSEGDSPLMAYDARSVLWDQVGKETLEIDGQKLECRVLRRTDVPAGREVKSWRAAISGKEEEIRSEDIQTLADGRTVSETIVVLKFKDEVAIGGDKVTCRVVQDVWEDISEKGVFRRTQTKWLTDRIATGWARQIVRQGNGLNDNEVTTVVTAFGAAKND